MLLQCRHWQWLWLLLSFCGWSNNNFICINARDVIATMSQRLIMMGTLKTTYSNSIRLKADALRSLSYNGGMVTTIKANYSTPVVSDVPLNTTFSHFYGNQHDLTEIPSYTRSTAMCFTIGLLIFGVMGNMMVPIVIMRTKDMRNSTNMFLINLSVADLLVLLICTPTVLIELNTKPEIWILGHTMCKIVPFVELTVAHASVLTILAISFERYYAICKPLKAGYICTKTRAILICFLAWFIAVFFTSPILWMAKYKYVNDLSGPVCFTQAITNWTIGFFIMIIIIFFIMPLIILIVLYGVISRKLIYNKRPLMRLRPTKLELNLKARNQVILMLGAVVVCFFLCLLPFRFLTLWIIFSSEQNLNSTHIEIYYNLLYFCRIMLYLNSAINPILYNVMSTKFRKAFYTLLCNLWSVLCLKCPAYDSQRKRHNCATVIVTTNSSTATSINTFSSVLSRSHLSNCPNNNTEECGSITLNQIDFI